MNRINEDIKFKIGELERGQNYLQSQINNILNNTDLFLNLKKRVHENNQIELQIIFNGFPFSNHVLKISNALEETTIIQSLSLVFKNEPCFAYEFDFFSPSNKRMPYGAVWIGDNEFFCVEAAENNNLITVFDSQEKKIIDLENIIINKIIEIEKENYIVQEAQINRNKTVKVTVKKKIK